MRPSIGGSRKAGYAGIKMIEEVTLGAPCCLVAVPQLGDRQFLRSVIFLIEHNAQGSMGLVINKPGSLSFGDFFGSQNMTYTGDPQALLCEGGPVQPERAFLLHSGPPVGPESEEVVRGLQLSYSMESLGVLAQRPPDHFRVYLGYTGWGPGQLAEELSVGAWLVGDADPRYVFHQNAQLVWEASLRNMGIDPVLLMHSGVLH